MSFSGFPRGWMGALGIQALDFTQVDPFGFIPVIATPPPADPLGIDPAIDYDSTVSVTISGNEGGVGFSRSFSGFKVTVATEAGDLDSYLQQGIKSRIVKVYVEYGWYYQRNGNPDLVSGTLKRVALVVEITEAPVTEVFDKFSQRKSVQVGSSVDFFIKPDYSGPLQANIVQSIIGPVFDLPYQSGTRIRMLPAGTISIEVGSLISQSIGPSFFFDPLATIPTNVTEVLATLANFSSFLGLGERRRLETYKYGYFMYNGASRINRPISNASLTRYLSSGSAQPESGKVYKVVGFGGIEGSDGGANFPVFSYGNGFAAIIPIKYSSVLCVTRKPVDFGASIQYIGKGVTEPPQSGDPRNGVPKSVIEEAGALNFSYISGIKLKSYLLAGGNQISQVQLNPTSRVAVPLDAGMTPLFSVNNEIDPLKEYLVVFLPAVNASISEDTITASEYSSLLYITYQSVEEVLNRRIHLDRSLIVKLPGIGGGLQQGNARASIYHSKTAATVLREIDTQLEKCTWAQLGASSSEADLTSRYFGNIPSLSVDSRARTLSYPGYVAALQTGVKSYSSHASIQSEFEQSCIRVRGVDAIQTGVPRLGNPFIPASATTEADVPDTADDLFGTPVRMTWPRLSQIRFRIPSGRLVDFPNGFFFADRRGICYMMAQETDIVLWPRESIPNSAWFDSFFANTSEIKIQDIGPAQMYVDISEASNSCLPDDLKIPYHAPLARAISKAPKYSDRIAGSGIGLPRLEFYRKFSSTVSRVGAWPRYGQRFFPDLSLAEFDLETDMTLPTIAFGESDYDPTTGTAILHSLHIAGRVKGVRLSRAGRLAIENVGPSSENLGKKSFYIVTEGSTDSMRASMDFNNRDGVVAARNESKFGVLHIESIRSLRSRSQLNSANNYITYDDIKWKNKKNSDLSSPFKSPSAFGSPFDSIPASNKGFQAICNSPQSFTERIQEISKYDVVTYRIESSTAGYGVLIKIPENAGFSISSVEVTVPSSYGPDICKHLYMSLCINNDFSVADDGISPPLDSSFYLWSKIDDKGRSVFRGPNYGSSTNIFVSSDISSMQIPNGTYEVKITWIANSDLEKWYPDMSSCSPYIDAYGSSCILFSSQDDGLGLSCYTSGDGDVTWNLMSHVVQGFTGERFEDVCARSDHSQACTYFMFKKDGMLLCKRIDDISMANDSYRIVDKLEKSKFRIGSASDVGQFVYALNSAAYKSGAFGPSSREVAVRASAMKVRLSSAYVVLADFANNAEYKEENANAKAVISKQYTKFEELNDEFFDKELLVPRIVSNHPDNPRYCLSENSTASQQSRFDIDPTGNYAFEVLPNGTLFMMIINEGSLFAFVSEDGGKNWKPSMSNLAFPIRPIKTSLDDEDSSYNTKSLAVSLGDALPIQGVNMCVDKFSDSLFIIYLAEGMLFGQRVPCASLTQNDENSIKLFSTAYLSQNTNYEIRPFFIGGRLSPEATSAIREKRSFFRVGKNYEGKPDKLMDLFGVDIDSSTPTLVTLQDGSIRFYFMTSGNIRGGYITGESVVFDGQLVSKS